MLTLLKALNLGEQPQFLPPDVMAQYEAGFGVLVINTDIAEFVAADAELKRVVNHETYHHLQTICTGYGWWRSSRIKTIAVRHINEAERREKKDNIGVWRVIGFLNWLSPSVQRKIDADRLRNTLMMLIRANWTRRLALQTDPSDPSLAAAEFPGLFAALDELRQELWRPHADGLADGHVIEGAAVAHDVLLTALTIDGPEALFPANAAELDRRIENQANPLGPEYTGLLAAARTRCNGPASLFLLPAAALALHYERPGAAFLPMIDRLRAGPPDAVAATARSLAAALPALPDAGNVLGTARQAAEREHSGRRFPWQRRRSEIHDQAFAALGSGVHDELTVLSDVAVFGELEGTIIGCAMRFNDRVVGIGGVHTTETAVRLLGASIVLRAQTRRSVERDLEQAMVDWAQNVLNRSFGVSA